MFAKTIVRSLRRRSNEEAIKAMGDHYPRPANIPNLTVPRVSQDVYDQLGRGSAIIDSSLQKIQSIVGRSISLARVSVMLSERLKSHLQNRGCHIGSFCCVYCVFSCGYELNLSPGGSKDSNTFTDYLFGS